MPQKNRGKSAKKDLDNESPPPSGQTKKRDKGKLSSKLAMLKAELGDEEEEAEAMEQAKENPKSKKKGKQTEMEKLEV